MISEYLRTSIIQQFKKRETDLLLVCIEDFGPKVWKVNTGFYDDNHNWIAVTYNIDERRFTELWYGVTKIKL